MPSPLRSLRLWDDFYCCLLGDFELWAVVCHFSHESLVFSRSPTSLRRQVSSRRAISPRGRRIVSLAALSWPSLSPFLGRASAWVPFVFSSRHAAADFQIADMMLGWRIVALYR